MRSSSCSLSLSTLALSYWSCYVLRYCFLSSGRDLSLSISSVWISPTSVSVSFLLKSTSTCFLYCEFSLAILALSSWVLISCCFMLSTACSCLAQAFSSSVLWLISSSVRIFLFDSTVSVMTYCRSAIIFSRSRSSAWCSSSLLISNSLSSLFSSRTCSTITLLCDWCTASYCWYCWISWPWADSSLSRSWSFNLNCSVMLLTLS